MEEEKDIVQVDYDENEEDCISRWFILMSSAVFQTGESSSSRNTNSYNPLCRRIYPAIFGGGCESSCFQNCCTFGYGTTLLYEYGKNVLLCHIPVSKGGNEGA